MSSIQDDVDNTMFIRPRKTFDRHFVFLYDICGSIINLGVLHWGLDC